MQRWPFQFWMQLLYGLVWATVVVITAADGRPVTPELFGLLAVGLVAIHYALRDKADPPEGEQ